MKQARRNKWSHIVLSVVLSMVMVFAGIPAEALFASELDQVQDEQNFETNVGEESDDLKDDVTETGGYDTVSEETHKEEVMIAGDGKEPDEIDETKEKLSENDDVEAEELEVDDEVETTWTELTDEVRENESLESEIETIESFEENEESEEYSDTDGLVETEVIEDSDESDALAAINWGRAVRITHSNQVVDSIAVNGTNVQAIYAPRGSFADDDTTYSCAAFVKRFYRMIFGINVYNLFPGNTPAGGEFNRTNSPVVGDIAASSGHWAVVKEVDGNQVTLIEQNCWGQGSTADCAMVGRTLNVTGDGYWFFHYAGNNLSRNHRPIGNLDSVEGGEGYIKIRGWAFDPDDPSLSIKVHVYIGGSPENNRVGEIKEIKANVVRTDVDAQYGCGKNHGFEATIATNMRANQRINVYAINIGQKDNTEYDGNVGIGYGYAFIAEYVQHSPIGNIDTIEAMDGTVTVQGWAFDPDDHSKTLDIHVYIGGNAVNRGDNEVHIIEADTSRPDVDKVYGCGQNHGFADTIQTSLRGQKEVHIYAINVAGANETGFDGHSDMGGGVVNISNDRNPVGQLNYAVGGKGSVTVKGWAFDSDDLSQPIDIHVYIGGHAGDPGTETHVIKAEKMCKEANEKFSCGNYHGFEETIKTQKTGDLEIHCYAINIGTGTMNPPIGAITANILEGTDESDDDEAKDGAPMIYDIKSELVSGNMVKVSFQASDADGVKYGMLNVRYMYNGVWGVNNSKKMDGKDGYFSFNYPLEDPHKGDFYEIYCRAVDKFDKASDEKVGLFVPGVPNETVNMAFGDTYNISDAWDGDIQWYTAVYSTPNIVKIENEKIVPTRKGETYVYFVNNKSGHFAPLLLKVVVGDSQKQGVIPTSEAVSEKSVAVTNILLNKKTASVVKGGKLTLSATIIPKDATDSAVSWKTSDGAIATVTSKGVVKGIRTGVATITVTTKNGKKASCKISVSNPVVKVKNVKLNRKTATLKKGKSLTLRATISPSNATNKSQTWMSSSKKVATVSSKGVVKGVKKGKATITVITKDGKKKATCKVTVK